MSLHGFIYTKKKKRNVVLISVSSSCKCHVQKYHHIAASRLITRVPTQRNLDNHVPVPMVIDIRFPVSENCMLFVQILSLQAEAVVMRQYFFLHLERFLFFFTLNPDMVLLLVTDM